MKKFFLSAAGVALAISSVAPAHAQVVPGGGGSSPVARPAYTGGPAYVLRHNDLDEHGRPRPMRIEDAIQEYGYESTQLLIRDDQLFCSKLSEFSAAEARIRAAEAELRAAEAELAAAVTAEQRRLAERKRDRARLNLLDVLLGVVGVGASFFIPGVGLPYLGMVAASQGQSLVRMKNSDKDAEMWYRWMDNYARQMRLYDGRLELYDLRMQLHSFRATFWDQTMNSYCDQNIRPYVGRTNVSYDDGAALIAAPGTRYRWQDRDVLPTGRGNGGSSGRW